MVPPASTTVFTTFTPTPKSLLNLRLALEPQSPPLQGLEDEEVIKVEPAPLAPEALVEGDLKVKLTDVYDLSSLSA